MVVSLQPTARGANFVCRIMRPVVPWKKLLYPELAKQKQAHPQLGYVSGGVPVVRKVLLTSHQLRGEDAVVPFLRVP